jgi:hypothetical protein
MRQNRSTSAFTLVRITMSELPVQSFRDFLDSSDGLFQKLALALVALQITMELDAVSMGGRAKGQDDGDLVSVLFVVKALIWTAEFATDDVVVGFNDVA